MLGKVFWTTFEKRAFEANTGALGALGGAISGYHSGRSAAGTTANAISRQGYKTKNEETARNIAKVTGIAGAVGGLALGLKHKQKIIDLARRHISNHPDMHHLYDAAVPFLAGTGGGAAAGAATGAATALRGAFKKKEKTAGVLSLVSKVTGVKDIKRGYKLIDRAVRTGHMLGSGAATTARGAAAKDVAGRAMAGGAGRLATTGLGTAYLLRKKDGGQTQGY